MGVRERLAGPTLRCSQRAVASLIWLASEQSLAVPRRYSDRNRAIWLQTEQTPNSRLGAKSARRISRNSPTPTKEKKAPCVLYCTGTVLQSYCVVFAIALPTPSRWKISARPRITTWKLEARSRKLPCDQPVPLFCKVTLSVFPRSGTHLSSMSPSQSLPPRSALHRHERTHRPPSHEAAHRKSLRARPPGLASWRDSKIMHNTLQLYE